MDKYYDIPLLITSAVKPVANVQISNVSERLLQYKLATLRWVVETPFNKIVFIDNTDVQVFSETEISQFNDYGVELEQIVTKPNPAIQIRGTSFGISEIYETAINQSELINNSKHFAKVTGRLFVENMEDLIDEIDENSSYLIRWLSKGIFRFKPGRFDERFGIYNKEFYINNLLPLKSKMDDSKDQWIETVYNEVLEKEKSKLKCFKTYPRIVGISGHYGKPYDGNDFIVWRIKDLIDKYFKVLRY
jgi:hypothetical protein